MQVLTLSLLTHVPAALVGVWLLTWITTDWPCGARKMALFLVATLIMGAALTQPMKLVFAVMAPYQALPLAQLER